MNDEVTVFENQDQDSDASHDFVAQTPAASDEPLATEGEETAERESDKTAIGVLTDPGADSDTDCKDPDPSPQKSELDELRSELTQLRQELNQSHARLAQMEHIERQYAEFCELYPNVSIASLSEEVWKSVGDGTPLAAAFALAEHRKSLSLKMATDRNAENRARSAGAVKNAESVEFSPSEVRAMSSEEVRANLSKIMRSMQKWH